MRGLNYDQERKQWRVQFTSKTTQPGKRYRERLPGTWSQRQAEAFLGTLLEEDRRGNLLWPNERQHVEVQPNNLPTVGEYAIEHYLPWCDLHNACTTSKMKEHSLKMLSHWFWEVPLDEVDLDLLQLCQYERKSEGLRDQTVNRELRTVRHLLQHAHKASLIGPPPSLKPLPEKDKKDSRWLSQDEARQALENAAKRGAVWHALTLFLLYTGARRRETRLLRWRDVHLDAEKPYVHLRASTAKQGRSRDIPLRKEVAEALAGLPKGGEYVFMRKRKDGVYKPMHDNLRCWASVYPWQGTGKELRFGAHVFRHTFATWHLQDGTANLVQVSRLLGHASIQQTADVYSHIATTDLHDVVNNGPSLGVKRLRAA